MRTITALALTTTFTAAFTLSLAAAAAPEGASCEVDADCDGDMTCEVTAVSGCAVPDCAPGEECPETTCESTEYRTCVAPPCQSNADCGAGLRCVRDTYESCTVCTAPPGEEAPADCGSCTTETYTACVPKLCDADADCGDENLVCIEETWESCSGVAVSCVPGEECPEPPPPECETESVSFCGPKYLAECTVDADCGEGFNCVPEESCACSGSAGIDEPPPVDPATDPETEPAVDPPVEECTCEPTGRNYCEPQEIECPNGDECPTDWECVPSPEPPIACAPDMECPEPEPSVPVCQPPMWEALEALGETSADGSAAADDRNLQTLLEAPAADPADNLGDYPTGDTTGSDSSSSSDSSGCSISRPNGSAPTAFGLLALLGLALAGRRRR